MLCVYSYTRINIPVSVIYQTLQVGLLIGEQMKVVVTEFMDQAALDGFAGFASVTYEPGLDEDRPRLLALAADANAIIVRNKTQVDRELLRHAPNLKVVGRLGVGLDNIDLNECESRGVAVCPATGANAISVAEYVICAAMTLVRGVYGASSDVISGNWPRGQLASGGEVYGRQLGLYGFGVIAQTILPRAKALGMNVCAYDPFLPGDHPAWAEVKAMGADELVATSDVLSLHVPLTPDTKNLMDSSALGKMKTGAILINTSRGGVVDEAAVVEALASGHLSGAALDVFEAEPLPVDQGGRFVGVPNLILTPHISGVTAEGNIRVSDVTVRNVLAVLNGETDLQPT